jgi:hypothetical protein
VGAKESLTTKTKKEKENDFYVFGVVDERI